MSPASERLARLRISLTVLFTAALAVGLAVLAVVAVRTDTRLRAESLESEMERRVAGSTRLIYYSNSGELRLDGVRDDDLTTGTPEVRVLLGTGPGPREIFRSRGPRLDVPSAELGPLSREAVRSEQTVLDTTADAQGDQVRLVAAPFYNDATERPAGAVVSLASLDGNEDSHRELIVTMLIGCGGLLVLAAGAGYLLAGRSLRPAVRGLEEQESFLADAAHELRTPVAAMRAQLEAAQLDTGERDAAIENAIRTSVRMGETVSALLARARIEAGTERKESSELQLDQLVEQVVAEEGGEADGVLLDADRSVVTGDPELLRIAVRNLVANARLHGAGPDGSTAIEVEVRDGAVTVSDRGPGFPAEVVEGGIRRFRSGGGEGTGLGLSIVSWIAEEHGGGLRVEERKGGGARATLALR